MSIQKTLFPLLGSVFCLAAAGAASAGEIALHDHASASLGPLDAGSRPGFAGFSDALQQTDAAARGAAPAQTFTISLQRPLDDQWALTASAGWQEWSKLRGASGGLQTGNPLHVANGGNYRDTWHLALGTRYRASDELLWEAGVAYDSSAIVHRERAFELPTAATWRLAAGLSYAFEKDAELNFNYAYVRLGDLPERQVMGAGEGMGDANEFSNAGIHVVSFSLVWWF
ncbi:outer membrane protein transport protein [Pseudomonas stutzeri]|nr:outer membrane protein transport protein [Stutzerimonas stutzeri]